ncbi:hypothetical protein BGZ83_009222 [Gryganskiella cystojenkinii]|nr:hypothetical protein BGZ83_009222 [Gryganskiella cystojenkinii]
MDSRMKKPSRYRFSGVFDEATTQARIFEETCLPLLVPLFWQDNHNSLLFAYGLSNSGKTHSIIGNSQADGAGILPRALAVVFKSIESSFWEYRETSLYRPVGFQDVELIELADRGTSEDMQDGSDDMALWVSKNKNITAIMEKMNIDVNEIRAESLTDADAISLPEGMDYTVWISCAELYTEKIYDLLADSAEFVVPVLDPRRPALQLKTDLATGHRYVPGLKEVRARNLEEALLIVQTGLKQRQISSTLVNSASSRSHCIFTIKVLKTPQFGTCASEDAAKGKTSVSRLSIVDLAGSERMRNTNSSGQRLKEAGNINNSLMVLGHCMEILRLNQSRESKKEEIVPYRHSKLTQLFQSSLDGRSKNSRVALIVNVNPGETDFDETIQALRFSSVALDESTTRTLSTNNTGNVIRKASEPTLRPDTEFSETGSGPASVSGDRLTEAERVRGILQNQIDDLREKLTSSESHYFGLEESIREEYTNDILPSLGTILTNYLVETPELKARLADAESAAQRTVELEQQLASQTLQIDSLMRDLAEQELDRLRLQDQLAQVESEKRNIQADFVYQKEAVEQTRLSDIQLLKKEIKEAIQTESRSQIQAKEYEELLRAAEQRVQKLEEDLVVAKNRTRAGPKRYREMEAELERVNNINNAWMTWFKQAPFAGSTPCLIPSTALDLPPVATPTELDIEFPSSDSTSMSTSASQAPVAPGTTTYPIDTAPTPSPSVTTNAALGRDMVETAVKDVDMDIQNRYCDLAHIPHEDESKMDTDLAGVDTEPITLNTAAANQDDLQEQNVESESTMTSEASGEGETLDQARKLVEATEPYAIEEAVLNEEWRDLADEAMQGNEEDTEVNGPEESAAGVQESLADLRPSKVAYIAKEQTENYVQDEDQIEKQVLHEEQVLDEVQVLDEERVLDEEQVLDEERVLDEEQSRVSLKPSPKPCPPTRGDETIVISSDSEQEISEAVRRRRSFSRDIKKERRDSMTRKNLRSHLVAEEDTPIVPQHRRRSAGEPRAQRRISWRHQEDSGEDSTEERPIKRTRTGPADDLVATSDGRRRSLIIRSSDDDVDATSRLSMSRSIAASEQRPHDLSTERSVDVLQASTVVEKSLGENSQILDELRVTPMNGAGKEENQADETTLGREEDAFEFRIDNHVGTPLGMVSPVRQIYPSLDPLTPERKSKSRSVSVDPGYPSLERTGSGQEFSDYEALEQNSDNDENQGRDRNGQGREEDQGRDEKYQSPMQNLKAAIAGLFGQLNDGNSKSQDRDKGEAIGSQVEQEGQEGQEQGRKVAESEVDEPIKSMEVVQAAAPTKKRKRLRPQKALYEEDIEECIGVPPPSPPKSMRGRKQPYGRR